MKTMTISFVVENDELLMCYKPAYGAGEILSQLKKGEEKRIKNTFCVSNESLKRIEEEYEESFYFVIGKVEGNYILLDSDILMLEHKFYFSKDISLKQNMFVAYRNISILQKIDQIVDRDIYIGGEWEKFNGISKESFLNVINKFPNSSELNKYVHFRIAGLLKEYFPECDKYEVVYEKYINSKRKYVEINTKDDETNTNIKIELEQFSIALDELQYMLSNIEEFNESSWQKKIRNIIQLLYPKYILCTPEVTFKGVDGYDKRPDFLLVDVNGFIDILEIKRSDVQVLTKQASYRNNYVPVREFAGAIQQIEKYIYCLNSITDKEEAVLKLLSEKLPEGVIPQVLNPQGILLLGRSKDFNQQQKRDFELIKRQYKNIADIMTYDDLACRIRNIVLALKERL